MKYKKLALLCYFIAVSGLVACWESNEQSPAHNKEKVVAIVYYDKIHLSQLQEEIDRFTAKYGISLKKKKRKNKVARNILDELILEKIYLQEAKRLKITILDEELEAHLKHITGEYSKENLRKMFVSKNIDYSKWYAKFKKNMLLEKLINQEVKTKIVVKESEIKSYYEKHSEDYMLPERIQALQIVVNNELEAEAIYNKLQDGADFFKLAKSESVSPEGVHGGDLGFFSQGQMPKEFDDAIFSLKVGEFSKVVQSPYGYHIFKVIKKKEPGTMNFNDAWEKIKEKLAKEKEKKTFLNWVNKLKDSTPIVINKDVLLNGLQKS